MGTLKGFAPPFGPPPATPAPLASPFGDFGTGTSPTTPARSARALALGLAIPSRDGAPPAEPAGSPRDYSHGNPERVPIPSRDGAPPAEPAGSPRVPTTAYALTPPPDRGKTLPMPVIKSIKDIVVGQALRLAGNPRVSKLASDPRLMNAAMKALSLGGTLKSGMDKAGGLAAGAFGLATQQEVANLRATITQLEDTVSTLEAKTAAARTPPSP